MKNSTKTFFDIHSWLGLLAGGFMILIGLTGSLLVFSDEIDALLYKDLETVVPEGNPLSFNALKAKVLEQFPNAKILRLRKGENPEKAAIAIIELEAERQWVFVNPYSGQVAGMLGVHSRLTNILLRLHFTLLLRPFGDATIALVGLGFIGLSLTGLWVQRRSLFSVYQKSIRWKSGAKVAAHDLHLLLGSASILFCFTLAVSGFYMMLYTFDVEWWKKQFEPQGAVTGNPSRTKDTFSADSLAAKTEALISGIDVTTVIYPPNEKAPIRIAGYVKTGNPFIKRFSSYVNFKQDGSVEKIFDVREASVTEKVEMTLEALHFGQFGGVWIKIIYALGGFTPAILSITGVILWVKRRRRKTAEPKVSERAISIAPKGIAGKMKRVGVEV